MLTPSELFNLLSDETRLRSLILLNARKELCVCELCAALKCIQPKISRHLALLRKSGLILDERRGQWVYYRINLDLPKWVNNIIKTHFDSLSKIEPFRSDIKKIIKLQQEKIC